MGMTRAMDTLVMTRARYRRRYGNDMPEPSIASRFLEEVPSRLVEDLGSPAARPQFSGSEYGSIGRRGLFDALSEGNRLGGGTMTRPGNGTTAMRMRTRVEMRGARAAARGG